MIRDPYDYVEAGYGAPECWCGNRYCDHDDPDWGRIVDEPDEPDEPQGGEHYIERDMREERER